MLLFGNSYTNECRCKMYLDANGYYRKPHRIAVAYVGLIIWCGFRLQSHTLAPPLYIEYNLSTGKLVMFIVVMLK